MDNVTAVSVFLIYSRAQVKNSSAGSEEACMKKKKKKRLGRYNSTPM